MQPVRRCSRATLSIVTGAAERLFGLFARIQHCWYGPFPRMRRSQPGDLKDEVHRTHKIRFVIISLIFLLVQIAVLGLGWGALRMINATRAYATGESYYSKASDSAVLNLYKYANTGKDLYWEEFRAALNVTFGDRQAREALDQPDPDLRAATAGFLFGRNNIDDIPDAILVFRLFRNWAPFEAAVEDWRRGDETINALWAIAAELRSRLQVGSIAQPKLGQLIDEIEVLNARLIKLESSFAEHIALAARTASTLVTLVLCLLTGLLWSGGVALAWRAYRKGIGAEMRVRAGQERFRNFAEVASDWFWETDRNLKITYVSTRFAQATGVPPEHLLGKRSDEAGLWVVATEDDESQPVRSLARPKVFRGYMHRYVQENGEEQYWNISGLPIFDAAGRFAGYRGTGTNVTHEVQASRVLREAKEQSDLANRAKSEFLANMSHELRTPLNAILGFSEITKNQLFGKASDKYIEYAGDIFNSGSLLLALIDDILDLAKIEAGRMELYEDLIDVEYLVETTTDLLRQKLRAAEIELTTILARGLPPIYADERKLKQIILNLLSNSIKFTPAGGSISLSVQRDDAGNLEMIVADTGIGIAPEDIKKVLEPFGQVENSLTRTHGGTGLGLPLVRALTELHDGTFALNSAVGRGTNVSIKLPRQRLGDHGDQGSCRYMRQSDLTIAAK
jgi:PAS domain S-box-containing protein